MAVADSSPAVVAAGSNPAEAAAGSSPAEAVADSNPAVAAADSSLADSHRCWDTAELPSVSALLHHKMS